MQRGQCHLCCNPVPKSDSNSQMYLKSTVLKDPMLENIPHGDVHLPISIHAHSQWKCEEGAIFFLLIRVIVA